MDAWGDSLAGIAPPRFHWDGSGAPSPAAGASRPDTLSNSTGDDDFEGQPLWGLTEEDGLRPVPGPRQEAPWLPPTSLGSSESWSSGRSDFREVKRTATWGSQDNLELPPSVSDAWVEQARAAARKEKEPRGDAGGAFLLETTAEASQGPPEAVRITSERVDAPTEHGSPGALGLAGRLHPGIPGAEQQAEENLAHLDTGAPAAGNSCWRAPATEAERPLPGEAVGLNHTPSAAETTPPPDAFTQLSTPGGDLWADEGAEQQQEQPQPLKEQQRPTGSVRGSYSAQDLENATIAGAPGGLPQAAAEPFPAAAALTGELRATGTRPPLNNSDPVPARPRAAPSSGRSSVPTGGLTRAFLAAEALDADLPLCSSLPATGGPGWTRGGPSWDPAGQGGLGGRSTAGGLAAELRIAGLRLDPRSSASSILVEQPGKGARGSVCSVGGEHGPFSSTSSLQDAAAADAHLEGAASRLRAFVPACPPAGEDDLAPFDIRDL